ncbi:MAG: tRNA (N6-isopentenyl adenosine(37)-C2)-methylthiotransferase MiaB [Alphaproteobacteria bacterium CG11_big_fil_rev_8_21_14_0_20_44_7]|nr:MAG: tRNA (N6-isopentenyl adenosine(37)-C2)-methylthiotransferase MiaB [Alphaproteobacteria bacterium CG11_big_fil_rev_8_21_14_0_20_44_7]
MSSENKKKLFIKTYGCQMNVYDSHKMADVMSTVGYELVDDYANADMTIVNTCHIREKATDKLYCELGRINKHNKKNNREMMIAVAGCVGQAEGDEIMRRAPYVNLVVGPQSYHQLPELIAKTSHKKSERIQLDFAADEKFDSLPAETTQSGSSVFLTIQEGCDKFCTFCVVPYTRGAEYSRPAADIIAEAKRMADNGAVEITLLGQNVNAYDDGKSRLTDLATKIAEINGIERIRYTTSHPRDMDDELIAAHGSIPELMPFLHLPVQSGSDNILQQMNRKHTAEFYLEIIAKLRKARPDIAFSSDFIVGFPGESDKDFEDTMKLVEQVNYAQCYSFKYSPRPGTPGALREDTVAEALKSERLAQLQALINRQQNEYNKKFVGKNVKVLLDRKGKYKNQIIGKTPYMQSVHLTTKLESFGNIVDVRITEMHANSLGGEIIDIKKDNIAA